MKTSIKCWMGLLGCLSALFFMTGCGTPAQAVTGNRPEDRMNPAMTAHQKEVRAARSQQSSN